MQMEQSLILLGTCDPVSALTLAGAAEEILRRMVERKGGVPKGERNAEYLGSIFEYFGKQRPSKKKLIGMGNKYRNELKHQDNGRNVSVEADFRFEAEEMLLRCMFNYFDAFGCYPRNKQLRSWFEHMTL